jgi:tripartite-type tricarboxylate transporter receptor subunit TctC
MPFDSDKWVPISIVASVPYVLDVRKGLGVSNVKELIQKAKENPGKLTAASPGAGTVGHLASKQFEMLAGIKLTTVPYKGLAPALQDVMGEQVDMIFDTATTSLPFHNSDKLKIIAVGSAKRWPGLPEIPTVQEAGLAGFRAVTWYGIVAPPGTPADLATKISNDVRAVIHDPEVAASIKDKLHMDPIGSTNAEAAATFADDVKLWSNVIKEAKISLD